MKTILITGASGLLGQYLSQSFATKYKVVGIYHSTTPKLPKNTESIQLDLANAVTLKEINQNIKPDFIIHTAGYTSVDDCELNPSTAFEQNVTYTKNVRDALEGLNTKLVLISTDHLFSGLRRNYSEESQVEPLNIYAQTKYQAEQETLKFNNSLVIRTNFYGGHTEKKMSFSTWIINELKQGKKINMFEDVYFTPISICGLAENLDLIINSNRSGIYNIVGSERLSKYEFALKLAETFNLPQSLITLNSINNFKLKAKRPKDMSLSSEKVINDLPGFQAENVSDGLKKIKSLNLI